MSNDKVNYCPLCQTNDIQGHSFTVGHDVCWQRVSCNECNAEWYDVYHHHHIEMVNPEPKGEENE